MVKKLKGMQSFKWKYFGENFKIKKNHYRGMSLECTLTFSISFQGRNKGLSVNET